MHRNKTFMVQKYGKLTLRNMAVAWKLDLLKWIERES